VARRSVAGADLTIQAVSRGARVKLCHRDGVVGATVHRADLMANTYERATKLVEMRADLVSAVTHELQTPLASIRAASETIASGRVATG